MLYFTPSSEDKKIIHFTYEIPIHGNDKLFKRGKKKANMIQQAIAKQMRDLKLKGKSSSLDGMDESATSWTFESVFCMIESNILIICDIHLNYYLFCSTKLSN